jgi:5-methylcytosine-specific restriction protein A
MPKLNTLKPRISTLDTRQGVGVAVERIRGYELTKIRERILLRDGYTCRVCGRVTAQGEVDHVVPLAVGGGNNAENLQYLCKSCHKIKSDKEEKDRG